MRANRELRPLIGEASLAVRPSNQLAAQELIQPPQRRHGKYRFYYAVVFRQKGRASSSVLLGGSSINEIETLGAELLAFRDSIVAPDRFTAPFSHIVALSRSICGFL